MTDSLNGNFQGLINASWWCCDINKQKWLIQFTARIVTIYSLDSPLRVRGWCFHNSSKDMLWFLAYNLILSRQESLLSEEEHCHLCRHIRTWKITNLMSTNCEIPRNVGQNRAKKFKDVWCFCLPCLQLAQDERVILGNNPQRRHRELFRVDRTATESTFVSIMGLTFRGFPRFLLFSVLRCLPRWTFLLFLLKQIESE